MMSHKKNKKVKADKVAKKKEKSNLNKIIGILGAINNIQQNILQNTLVIDNKVELLRRHTNEYRKMMGMPPVVWEKFIKDYRGGQVGPPIKISTPEEVSPVAKLEKDEPDGTEAPEDGNESTDDPDTNAEDEHPEGSTEAQEPEDDAGRNGRGLQEGHPKGDESEQKEMD